MCVCEREIERVCVVCERGGDMFRSWIEEDFFGCVYVS